ncbi:MAG: hypothetical protein JXA97_08505 [Anaerolineales bacterium]|nr:hypothetical protein [Anaerolineales bacterium]
MIPLTARDIQIILTGSVFLLGSLCVLMGTFVMISRGYSRDVQALAAHTARLGRKGLAEEVTGLVTSATELMTSINNLAKTATGIGIFLILLGIGLLGASYWLVTQMGLAIL